MNAKWTGKLSQPKYKMKIIKDVYITMRDGVKVAVDIYAPDADGEFPALLSMSCYGKDVQKLPVVPGPIDWTTGNGGMEAGDSEYFVSRGYVHVIADGRGTGLSGGGYRFFSTKEQEDGFDLVEWMAKQPWSDGNVGMLGMSYFAMIQYLVAAQNPPHLKAIFAHDGMTDIYRNWYYHGGNMHYGFLFQWWGHVPAHTVDALPVAKEKLEEQVQEAKMNPDVRAYPVADITLNIPEKNIPLFDALIHPNDGPYYWERSAYTKFDKIRVPTYLLSRWTAWHSHLPGAFSAYSGITAPKKLRVGMPDTWEGFSRPWCENHELILRWYDFWLKGIDTGIMDEPPVSIFIREENKWRFENEWPLARTIWTKYFLREEKVLSETVPSSKERPDDFISTPRLKQADRIPALEYATNPLSQQTEVTGPLALYLYAALDTPDANWVAEIHDISPEGAKKLVSIGWLKASHRELDTARSEPYKPYHPHTKGIPVKSGEINEYAIEMRETSYLFKAGHRIGLIVKGQDLPYPRGGPELFREVSYHLNSSCETRHTIYHNSDYQSYLLLPIIPG